MFPGIWSCLPSSSSCLFPPASSTHHSGLWLLTQGSTCPAAPSPPSPPLAASSYSSQPLRRRSPLSPWSWNIVLDVLTLGPAENKEPCALPRAPPAPAPLVPTLQALLTLTCFPHIREIQERQQSSAFLTSVTPGPTNRRHSNLCWVNQTGEPCSSLPLFWHLLYTISVP